MQLRPYQQDCLDATLNDLRTNPNVLIQAATGAGKTIFFSALIRHCMEQYQMRIGVVAHREQLVRQAADKLLKVWPEGAPHVGLACASVSSNIELERPVVIGSPQTLANRIGDMPPLHMLIVDECHRLPPENVQSQYGDLIHSLRNYYPEMRLVGVTATPFRLQHGYIYGTQCRRSERNWFGKLTYNISIATLQEQGFLVPYRALQAHAPDLSKVKKTAGEYSLSDLGKEMSGALHVGSAVKAVQEYAADRQHIVVFAVTIEHARALRDAFRAAGYTAACVHSKQPQAKRLAILDDFDHGRLHVVCNVGILTEGWDCTSVDCMVMCRPTLSPALYVQMVGRGLRLHEGKKDCLLLDLSGNWIQHGDPNEPLVDWREGRKSQKPVLPNEEQAPGMECPTCHTLVKAAAITCPWCGAELKVLQNERLQMTECVAPPPPVFGVQEARVLDWNIAPFTSRAGNYMLKLSLSCAIEGKAFPVNVNHFMDIEGQGSARGQFKALVDMRFFIGHDNVPQTVDEAMDRVEELHIPDTVWIEKNGQYYNIKKWGQVQW